jgi:hypothetical protein
MILPNPGKGNEPFILVLFMIFSRGIIIWWSPEFGIRGILLTITIEHQFEIGFLSLQFVTSLVIAFLLLAIRQKSPNQRVIIHDIAHRFNLQVLDGWEPIITIGWGRGGIIGGETIIVELFQKPQMGLSQFGLEIGSIEQDNPILPGAVDEVFPQFVVRQEYKVVVEGILGIVKESDDIMRSGRG